MLVYEGVFPDFVALILGVLFEAVVELVVVGIGEDGVAEGTDDLLELGLGEAGEVVVEVVEVVAGVEAVLEEDVHLLRRVVLVHGHESEVIDRELEELLVLRLELPLLGLQHEVSCEAV